jgi:hypothetical protein
MSTMPNADTPIASKVLDHVAQRAVGWSTTADSLKSRLERARWAVFALSIAGALMAAVASQIPETAQSLPARTHAYVAATAALLLIIGTFFSHRFLGQSETQNWVRARAASEALKREAFRFAAQAAPYTDPAHADKLLDAERDRIEKDLDDLLGKQVAPNRQGGAPRHLLSPQEYRDSRLVAQAQNYYRRKAEEHRRTARTLKRVEMGLALAATVVTALAGATGRAAFATDWPFDLAALTAVLTTVSGAILAHIEASRLDHLIVTYLATARRLEDRDLHFDAAAAAGGSEWSQFVNQCEDIIAAENSSWVSKWTSDKAVQKP